MSRLFVCFSGREAVNKILQPKKFIISLSLRAILENYHQPKRPAAVDTEHPKSAIKANKFKINPGILDLGFPV